MLIGSSLTTCPILELPNVTRRLENYDWLGGLRGPPSNNQERLEGESSVISFSGEKGDGKQIGIVFYVTDSVIHSTFFVCLLCLKHCARMSWGKEIKDMQFLSDHLVGEAREAILPTG